jgi:hypothetical protein
MLYTELYSFITNTHARVVVCNNKEHASKK